MEIVFKKLVLANIKKAYEIYCEIENTPVTNSGIGQAENIYQNLIKLNNYTLGAFYNNELIGVINVYKNMQYYPTDLDSPFVHLECCMIQKAYQHKGVGSALLEHAVRMVKNEGCTYIIAQSPVMAMQKILYKSGLTDTTSKNFGWERE